MTATPSDLAGPSGPAPTQRLAAVRDGVLRRPGLRCRELRTALSDAFDECLAALAALAPARPGLALAAVGGLGRRELAPYSDLDLLLLHDGSLREIGELADAIWYPIWDAKIDLDHSVRTPDQAVAVADDDLRAALGLIDVRHIAGDAALTTEVHERVRSRWRAAAPERVDDLRAAATERAAQFGDAAFLLEPNLKDSRGGLRDAQAIIALAVAQLIDVPPVVRQAYADLLDVRAELHRVTTRAQDVLRLQEQDAVAIALERLDREGEPDRDSVLHQVNSAARVIAHNLDSAWRRLRPSTRRRRFGRAPVAPRRIGLARDVVGHGDEVVLALDADPAHDGGLVLRAARAAAENDLPFSDGTLARLHAQATPLERPWPAQAREDFVVLLGTGAAAVGVLEALDLAGLLEPLIPEWALVRSRAQHNPVHTYTVDRHLLQTAAAAAQHAREVDRPDLLLVGALLHDIGKGVPSGDHSITGARLACEIATRMGFPPEDVGVIAALARHHLLLPDTATRRDPDDPATVRIVTDAVGDSAQLLDLLHALTIADAAGTGPAAWSDWKAGLVADLVHRVRLVQRGAAPTRTPALDPQLRALAEQARVAVVVGADAITVAVPDRIGALYRTAGVLALNLLDVRSAQIHTHAGMAVNHFVVEPRFGRMPDPARLREELIRVTDGDTGLAGRLREKERSYARPTGGRLQPPSVRWVDGEATDATLVEYRAADTIGLLCRVTAALERCQLDVRGARVSSLAGSVVDSFYITERGGALVSAARRAEIEAELLRA